jgi:hypothetical protein
MAAALLAQLIPDERRLLPMSGVLPLTCESDHSLENAGYSRRMPHIMHHANCLDVPLAYVCELGSGLAEHGSDLDGGRGP